MSEQTPKHSVSVAGIVVNDHDEVLVIKRADNGKWEMPGGVLELNETFEEGVIREVREETGITVAVERLTGVYKNMKGGIVALVFRCSPLSSRPTKSIEAAQILWMTRDVAQSSMDPAFSIRVADAFREQVNMRHHDGVELL